MDLTVLLGALLIALSNPAAYETSAEHEPDPDQRPCANFESQSRLNDAREKQSANDEAEARDDRMIVEDLHSESPVFASLKRVWHPPEEE